MVFFQSADNVFYPPDLKFNITMWIFFSKRLTNINVLLQKSIPNTLAPLLAKLKLKNP